MKTIVSFVARTVPDEPASYHERSWFGRYVPAQSHHVTLIDSPESRRMFDPTILLIIDSVQLQDVRTLKNW